VPQPFYLRQLVYQRVADGMVALGVRRNDFGACAHASGFSALHGPALQLMRGVCDEQALCGVAIGM
jgi:hypothetical protein